MSAEAVIDRTPCNQERSITATATKHDNLRNRGSEEYTESTVSDAAAEIKTERRTSLAKDARRSWRRSRTEVLVSAGGPGETFLLSGLEQRTEDRPILAMRSPRCVCCDSDLRMVMAYFGVDKPKTNRIGAPTTLPIERSLTYRHDPPGRGELIRIGSPEHPITTTSLYVRPGTREHLPASCAELPHRSSLPG